jgi:AbrB family looped-hinge helix DNA binding protein
MSKANRPEDKEMALVKLLRGGQLTLPAETRKALRLKEGDYLEAEVTEGGVLLKPVAVVDRRKAWRKIREPGGGRGAGLRDRRGLSPRPWLRRSWTALCSSAPS